MKSYQTDGVITERGTLAIHDRDAFIRAMAELPHGEYWITVERKVAKRSRDQNAYLHAVPFPIIAEFIGESVEDVKYDLMGEYWGWKPSLLNSNRMIPVKPSTSSMTVEECSKFIDWLIPWAMQTLGVAIPLPNEAAA